MHETLRKHDATGCSHHLHDEGSNLMTQHTMHGKVCLVTGSSSGLGKATALRLAELGATVILGCRDKERGAAALAEIKAASGNETVELMLIDLSAQQSVRTMVEEFKKRHDRLDVLI